MNVINCDGQRVFIFTFHMGVAGVATASDLRGLRHHGGFAAQTRAPGVYQPEMEYLKPNFSMIRKILHIGIPNGLENSFFPVGKSPGGETLSPGFGTRVQIASNTGGEQFGRHRVYPPANAMNLAMITVIGQCVGARDYDQAVYYTKN